jgi:hypothetical protein
LKTLGNLAAITGHYHQDHSHTSAKFPSYHVYCWEHENLSGICEQSAQYQVPNIKFSFQKSSGSVDGGARTDTGRCRPHEKVHLTSLARLSTILPASLVASVGVGAILVRVDAIDVRREMERGR